MSEHTRREFLWKTIPGVALAGVGLTALQPLAVPEAEAQQPAAAPRDPRSYLGTRYGLELDGQFAGWIESAQGGDATAPVVLEKLGADNIQHKHLAGVKYEDIVVSCGTGMSKSFYEWIKATFEKKFVRKNGAIIAFDYNVRPVSRLEWANGLITEVGFPACDVASKNLARMTIKITPMVTRTAGPTLGKPSEAVRKQWLPANFRLQIAGCPAACTRVNKIEAITVKTAVVEYAAGSERSYNTIPAHLEVPNLAVTTLDPAEFYQWLQDFVIKGNNGADREKTGTLEFLAPDQKEALFTLTFRGLGIFKLTPEAGNEMVPRATAEMYCEDIGFAYSA